MPVTYVTIVLHILTKIFAYITNACWFVLFISTCKTWRKWIYISEYTDTLIHTTITCTLFIGAFAHSSIFIYFYYINAITRYTNSYLTGVISLTILCFVFCFIYYCKYFKVTKMKVRVHGIFVSILVVSMYIHVYWTWKHWYIWILPGITIHITEMIHAHVFGKRDVAKARIHSDSIVELSLHVDDTYIGKTVRLRCPDISIFEWHPFTVTKHKSVYIKRRGDWTRTLYESVFVQHQKNVNVQIDGPYKNMSGEIIKWIQTTHTVLICSGIGITSFIAVLERCYTDFIPKHVHVIVVVKCYDDIVWFDSHRQCLLEKDIEIDIYITDWSQYSMYTRYLESSNIIVGRPDFKHILDKIYLQTHSTCNNIHVFYSGNDNLYNSLRHIIKDYSIFSLH